MMHSLNSQGTIIAVSADRVSLDMKKQTSYSPSPALKSRHTIQHHRISLIIYENG